MLSRFALGRAVAVAGAAALLTAGAHTAAAASKNAFTIAVFGDWPYSKALLDNASLLIDSVNADPDVTRVIHVGDIHSGSMPCTSAGILPPLSTSVPDWNVGIYALFQKFQDPLVYTPGDNEWTDCHKAKEFSSGDPLEELASVRSLFFARSGHTLGLADALVETQAVAFDPAYPADATFVENVRWSKGPVMFVTVDVPGSNNDTAPWTGTFSSPVAQADEVQVRTAADLRWLESTFAMAATQKARAVVIATQADMFDPAALVPGGDGLSAYTPIVQKMADLAVAFGKPVLLLNGDSHVYGSDHPLADPTSATGMIHHTQAVPNLERITVQGSTSVPAEWLKLTIDPHAADPFTFVNVPYCANPAVAC